VLDSILSWSPAFAGMTSCIWNRLQCYMFIKRKGIVMRKKSGNRKAFTLVEMLVVILIISLIAGIMAPKVFKGLGKAKRDIARAKMTTIESAIAQFQIAYGRLPDESLGLMELIDKPDDIEVDAWAGPYLKLSDLDDPWGNEYIYVEEGEINPGNFDLISLGADGQEGGEKDNADIFNE